MKRTELDGDLAKETLAKTGLDIMLVGSEEHKDSVRFFAAHNSVRSVVVLAISGEEVAVWTLTEASERDRRAACQRVRDKFNAVNL